MSDPRDRSAIGPVPETRPEDAHAAALTVAEAALEGDWPTDDVRLVLSRLGLDGETPGKHAARDQWGRLNGRAG